ncbi:MAG TPA: hypothetical protein VGY56_07455 [Verrucomicrobiae bacterium]|nr:hypothetical protein [Verrucomicrobiae bacterium]
MGSPGAALSSLSLDGGGALQFAVANNFTNAAVSKITSDNTGVISISATPIALAYPSQYPLINCPGGGASGIKLALGALAAGYQGIYLQRQFEHDLAGGDKRPGAAEISPMERRGNR